MCIRDSIAGSAETESLVEASEPNGDECPAASELLDAYRLLSLVVDPESDAEMSGPSPADIHHVAFVAAAQFAEISGSAELTDLFDTISTDHFALHLMSGWSETGLPPDVDPALVSLATEWDISEAETRRDAALSEIESTCGLVLQ